MILGLFRLYWKLLVCVLGSIPLERGVELKKAM